MNYSTIQQLQNEVAFTRNEAAYKQLFVRFYDLLLQYAHRLVTSSVLAEELVSDVMLKVWTMEEKLSQVQNLKVFLYVAVRNAALNSLAKNTRHRCCRSIDDGCNFIESGDGTPEEIILQAEGKKHLQKAVAALPEKCRTVYQLVREEGLTYKEVAAILHISENTVDRHLNNALHKLVAALSAYFEKRSPLPKKTKAAVGSWNQIPVLSVLPSLAIPEWTGSYTY